jgi:hypothetical protein
MAMRRGDVDSQRRAFIPRIPSSDASSEPAVDTPVTIPPHTHDLSVITATPLDALAGTTGQEQVYELLSEKLARDGSQEMLGALDMDHHSINNIDDADIEGTATIAEDITMTGASGLARATGLREVSFNPAATGEATVNNARVVHMLGADEDSEALIDGLERVAFNSAPAASVVDNPSRIDFNAAVVSADYSALISGGGTVAWDALERDFVAWIEEPGSTLLRVPFGWAAWIVLRDGETTLAGPRVVVPRSTDGTLVTVAPWDGSTEHQPELTDSPMAVVVPSLSAGDFCVAIAKGIARGVSDGDETWGVGDSIWAAADGTLTYDRPDAPTPSIYVGRVIGRPSEISPWDLHVDVRVIPGIGELSGVSREAPESLDVMVYDATLGAWVPRALFHVTAVSEAYTALPEDNVLACDASGGAFTVTLPAASGSAAMQIHVKKIDASANAVTVDADGSELIDGNLTFDLRWQDESLMLQCDGAGWYVL